VKNECEGKVDFIFMYDFNYIIIIQFEEAKRNYFFPIPDEG
jgi:hypothetical protein